MNNRLMTRVKQTGAAGFTLIELLIVIVILGILAGIVVFAVGNARGDSVTASCSADKKTINTAAEAGKAKTGTYPTTLAAMVTANLIKAVPNGGTNYTIVYDAVTGTATNTCP